MAQRTFYVIDDRSNTIVNAITTLTRARAEDVVAGMRGAEHLHLDEHPPETMLDEYHYWADRP